MSSWDQDCLLQFRQECHHAPGPRNAIQQLDPGLTPGILSGIKSQKYYRSPKLGILYTDLSAYNSLAGLTGENMRTCTVLRGILMYYQVNVPKKINRQLGLIIFHSDWAQEYHQVTGPRNINRQQGVGISTGNWVR